MTTRIAPASLFRASAVASFDPATGTPVPWLASGFHLRVKLNPWIGFPIHPFGAWRLFSGEGRETVPITWRDRDGRTLSVPFDLESVGGFALGAVLGTAVDDPWIWMDLDVDDRGCRVDVMEGSGAGTGADRVTATRSRRPFRFGHTRISNLRATGAGTIRSAIGIRVTDLILDELPGDRPDVTFGLPLPFGNWYTPGPHDPLAAAATRVKEGAPDRLSPPDDPTALVSGNTSPSDEADRIVRSIAPTFVDPWLVAGFGDPTRAPTAATRDETGFTDLGRALSTTAPVTPSLLTMAVDPQIARYLGLATMIGFDAAHPIAPANIWLIASRWAVQRSRTVLRLDDLLGTTLDLGDLLGPVAAPGVIDARMDGAFPDAECLLVDIPQRKADENGPWSIVTLLALAVAAGEAPPDPPDRFDISAAESGAWNAPVDPDAPGPESWRQSISLGKEPARGMVGAARIAPGEAVPLQRVEPPEGLGFLRRCLPLVPNWASSERRVVTDRSVPADPGGAIWFIWQADEFGQWSQPAELELPPPARPAPPPPLVEATYTARPDDGSSGPRTAGDLRLVWEVPELGRSAPGSLPIASLHVVVDGVAQPTVGVVPGQRVDFTVSPQPFGIGEQRAVPIESWFADTDLAESEHRTISCDAFDARAPRAIPTSPVLIWTGEPDATGHAELAVRWPPRAGAARYRVYLGDGRRLANAAALPMPEGAVRSALSAPVHAASSSFSDKQLFTFLGEAPATTDADGRVRFDTRVTGGLRAVQFLRIVPLSAGGAEAPFQTCGLVPVAVPMVERPPIPALTAVIDPDTGLTLTVRAQGMRPDLLAASPGAAPEYRLRRTYQAPGDRAYVPVIHDGSLADVDGDGIWTATHTVPVGDLHPFVRTSWLVEVRYPPEPPIPPGPVPLPVDGGVEPVWSTIGSSAEGIWSDPSLVATSLLVPRTPPPAPAAPTVTVQPTGAVSIVVDGLPVAHPAALGPFHLEIYRSTPGSSPLLQVDLPVTGPELTWEDPAPPAGARFDLLVVDPIGRRGPARRV